MLSSVLCRGWCVDNLIEGAVVWHAILVAARDGFVARWPRPQPVGLHGLDGRRRCQSGHHLWRDGRLRLARRRRPHAHLRPARYHPASARLGPHEAHLPPRRSEFRLTDVYGNVALKIVA